ncbi:FAD-dependent oxidoreductase [Vagococcus sp. BWB3-3]|uniref:FAD-dependent oxidoreductase n=1 Tax=Vagococcus allomyrinae TaxID=2794353 RepID=A0A940PCQ0_9ENTE|nr:FAD-dependent oxidoreductase [Vagococcus allomyrinae]MBP1040328.1 FAD-dependent oxidoreductase [Vagococcus allomyrinae]
MTDFRHSFTPFKIGSETIKNRYCLAPMGNSHTMDATGAHTPDSMEYFVERARGGFGLLYTGAYFSDLEVDANPTDPLLKVDSPLNHPVAFRASSMELNERISVYGAKMFAQITLGVGRNYLNMKAPSKIEVFGHPGVMAEALTKEEIKLKVDYAVKAAQLMQQSGFAGVEVHSIHWGYLLDQFALANSNHRTDEYGGSLENRLRISREVVEGIKAACGQDFPVTMRFSIKSYLKKSGKASLDGSEEYGRTIEEGIEICRLLESYGYDALNVDTGMYESYYYATPPMYLERGYMINFVKDVKKAINIPLLTGSHMNDPVKAEQAVKDGITDGIVIGRAAIADPEYPRKLQRNDAEAIRPCISCNIACIHRHLFAGVGFSCAVNPVASRELRYALKPNFNSKQIVVVGGGVAGMEAARSATLRGHKVILFEQKNQLGGHLVPGGSHQFKQQVGALNQWYQQELGKLDVEIHLEEKATVDTLAKINPDAVILASGSTSITPPIQGVDEPIVYSSIEALNNPEKIGENVLIIGGGLVGCEIALEYSRENKNVTIVENLPEILLSKGAPVPYPNKLMLSDLLLESQVAIWTNHQLTNITADGGFVSHNESKEATFIKADSIILAVGFTSNVEIASQLTSVPYDIYQIGDERNVSTIQSAIWDAYEVARSI